MPALPLLGNRVPTLGRALLLHPCSYGLMRRSPWLSPSSAFGFVRGVFAGCYQPLLPTGSSRRYLRESFPGCLIPYPGGPTTCLYLFLPLWNRPSPPMAWVGFPRVIRLKRLRAGVIFRGADISFTFRVTWVPQSRNRQGAVADGRIDDSQAAPKPGIRTAASAPTGAAARLQPL